MKKVLLHICCGVCALQSIERLKEEGFAVTGFFFNPNIYPPDEYLRRKKVVEEVRKITSIKVIEKKYEPRIWFDACGDYKDEPEGGKRCSLCYELRLKETFSMLKKLNFDYFATTLTISPHKNTKAIIDIGAKLGREQFLAIDFKKSNGFKKTMDLAKKYSLYRQHHCGCIYSAL